MHTHNFKVLLNYSLNNIYQDITSVKFVFKTEKSQSLAKVHGTCLFNFNPSILEAETGGYLSDGGQPSLPTHQPGLCRKTLSFFFFLKKPLFIPGPTFVPWSESHGTLSNVSIQINSGIHKPWISRDGWVSLRHVMCM